MLYLILILCFIYLLRIIVFMIGAKIELARFSRASADFDLEELPFVSVVVPARNEADKIEKCLLSIAKNDYPIDRYEIVAVNDRSTDNTGEVLDSLVDVIPNLVVVHNDNEIAIKNLRGKPGALQIGINHSKGEIILMTDADCTVNEQWIRFNAINYQDKNLGMTAGYTNVSNDDLFSSLQAVEWLYLHTFSMAGIGLGLPYGCFGNNISLSKEKFEKIGGYEALKFSVTEDLAMLQFMHNHKYKIRFLSNYESSITTYPNRTIKEYLNQHHRWILGGKSLGFKAFVFMLCAVAFWAALIIPLFTGDYYLTLLTVAVRVVSDWFVMIPSMIRLKRKDLFPYMLPSTFFLMLIEVVAPFLLFKRDVHWKDQVFYDASTYQEIKKKISQKKAEFISRKRTPAE